MPRPKKNEKRGAYLARAMPTIIREGGTQKQAIGKAYGLWKFYKNKKDRYKQRPPKQG